MNHIDPSAAKTLTLPVCFDFAASERVLKDLRKGLADGQILRLDASQVQTLHISGIQLLLAAARETNVNVINPSPIVIDQFAALAIDCPMSVESVPAAPAESSSRPIRVLAIDDSKTMRDMLRLTLASAGFDVVQAIDGIDGLDVLARERVDVVITDVNMPRLDGYGVIERLRAQAVYDAMPILVLTTESDPEKKRRARDLGATGFIVKPFDPETLVSVIHKVFPSKQH